MIQMTNNIFLNGICRPWNIHAPSFLALSLRVLAEVKGGSTLSDWRDKFSQFIPQRQSMQVDKNGIARISVYGTLFNKEAPYFVAGYGGSDYEEILDELKAANSDNNVKGILLSIDSPGGHACGNDKVAKAISHAKKPVFAHSDGMCCSAGSFLHISNRRRHNRKHWNHFAAYGHLWAVAGNGNKARLHNKH